MACARKFAVNGRAGGCNWRTIWSAVMGLAIASGVGAQDSTFSTTFGTAILCLDDLAPGHFYNTLRLRQPPYKIEDGAYWFKSTEQLFGAPLTDVFISDGSSRYDFVGAVSSLSPVELAAVVSVAAPAGGSFKRLNRTERYSIFVSRTGSEIAYHGKKGKIYCRRDRILLSN